MFETEKAERGIFMDDFVAFRQSGIMQVYTIILMMLLIYVAVGCLEWRLAQKEEWWKGIILPVAFLLLGNGSHLLGVILLVIYGFQRNKLQKEKNKMEGR